MARSTLVHAATLTTTEESDCANAMHDAGTYVRVLEERTGEKIAVLEEIAFLNGWIGVNELKKLQRRMGEIATQNI